MIHIIISPSCSFDFFSEVSSLKVMLVIKEIHLLVIFQLWHLSMKKPKVVSTKKPQVLFTFLSFISCETVSVAPAINRPDFSSNSTILLISFILGDSCVNQLIAITHEIYKSFDDGLEVRGVFLDISKAFDKVWHEGLLLKLSLNGISGNLLKLLRDFLYCRKQRVVLNGQNSSWENVNAGVPQGSILGPLLFLIYINDLSNEVSSNCKLFADDTSLFSVVNDIQSSAATLRNDLSVISNQAFQWKMIFNPDLLSKRKRRYLVEKLRNYFTPVFCSMTFFYRSVYLKNISG